jgi:hypothetical protein
MLNRWTAPGARPEFSFVAGVSTGRLLAHFVYLGPKYGHVARSVYTTYTTKGLVKKRGLVGIIEIDAAVDRAPLRAVIAKLVHQVVMKVIAEDYRKGRHLLIGTTNLDATRAVAWNIDQIAASGAPELLTPPLEVAPHSGGTMRNAPTTEILDEHHGLYS